MSNPFICNCRLKWLREWLKNSNLATGNPKCSYPEKLRDLSVANSNEIEFVCTEQDQDQKCFPNMPANKISSEAVLSSVNNANNCPKNCTCLNNIVRCSHMGLKQIPNDIPVTVKELYEVYLKI